MKSSVRKVVLAFVVALFAYSVYAQQMDSELKYNFVVWFHDGGKVSLPMDEHPVVTYSDGNIVVSASNSGGEYAHAAVRKFTIEEEVLQDSETTDVAVAERDAQWQSLGDVMRFSTCTPGERVAVYNATGQLVAQYAISSDGTLQIPLLQFEEGIYIVKIQSITYISGKI